jgi:hypothetical protein
MAKKCPTGFICSDWTTIWLVLIVVVAGLYVYSQYQPIPAPTATLQSPESKIIVVSAPAAQHAINNQMIRPDLYPEPVQRIGLSLNTNSGMFVPTRGPLGPIQQVGILTAEGGSSNSAAPDRTILPLFGRELDARRSRWNYYTRTDGTNPVQVPVRVRNRLCDDDTNGCDEVYNDDSIHVPALGRSFKATVYRRSMFI